MLDEETGELIERRLEHGNGEAKQFYTSLKGPVRVGIEATGHTRWFERLLAELRHELWVGDAARIHAADVRKQKTDARVLGAEIRQTELDVERLEIVKFNLYINPCLHRFSVACSRPISPLLDRL
jgi:hypothetical protein